MFQVNTDILQADGGIPKQCGVVIPQQIVAKSNENKKRDNEKKRGLRQVRVFRDTCNLFFVVARIVKDMPRSVRKMTDILLYETTGVLRLIGLAEYARDSRVRCEMLDEAIVGIHCVSVYLTVLKHLELLPGKRRKPRHSGKNEKSLKSEKIEPEMMVRVDADLLKKTDAAIDSITAQLTRWRVCTTGQGVATLENRMEQGRTRQTNSNDEKPNVEKGGCYAAQ